jgi:glycosyltransferase involved in cell wall biosynthesis
MMDKPILIYDLTQTQPEGNIKIHGGGEYGKEMLRFLLGRGIQDRYDLVPVVLRNKWIDEDLLGEVTASCPKTLFLERTSEYRDVIRDYDAPRNLFIFPLPDWIFIGDDLEIRKAKVVAVLHGFRFLELVSDRYEYAYCGGRGKRIVRWFLKHYALKEFTIAKYTRQYRKILRSFQSADVTVVLVSQFSMSSFKLYFGDEARRAKVIFPIVRSFEPRNQIVPPRPYFLTVGAGRWYKNLWRVLDALAHFDMFRKFFPGHKYVITSIDPALAKRVRKSFPGLWEFLDIRGYIGADEKMSLYKNAELFIYPSLNEGFGIPPIEAMSFGTPVLVSAISSIPEICAGAAEYMNAYNRADIANKILYLSGSEARRRELSRAGVLRFQELERETRSQYDELLSEIMNFASASSASK